MMAKKIGNIVLMIIGVIVAFYLIVLLTAWIAPIIVFLLFVASAGLGICYFVKRK